MGSERVDLERLPVFGLPKFAQKVKAKHFLVKPELPAHHFNIINNSTHISASFSFLKSLAAAAAILIMDYRL